MHFEVDKYKDMSPFEVKNELGGVAKKAFEKCKDPSCKVLNAGRGNPNFLNTTVRNAFSFLCYFSTEEAGTLTQIKDLGRRPKKEKIAEKLHEFLDKKVDFC